MGRARNNIEVHDVECDGSSIRFTWHGRGQVGGSGQFTSERTITGKITRGAEDLEKPRYMIETKGTGGILTILD